MNKPTHRRIPTLAALIGFLPIICTYWAAWLPARGASPGLTLTAKNLRAGARIPDAFTCDGRDVSPELEWSNAPQRTRSFALIVEDPDAPGGTWVHWVVYDLPAGAQRLPEGVPKQREIPDGGRQGYNDFGRVGYNGPCPPPGPPHRYIFRLYALDITLNLKGRVTRGAAEEAMQGHILAQTELTAEYQRK